MDWGIYDIKSRNLPVYMRMEQRPQIIKCKYMATIVYVDRYDEKNDESGADRRMGSGR